MGAEPAVVRGGDWLERIANLPIAFAQVREDALIDQWIARQLPDRAHGIMIASGGCTAALLAAGGAFERLALVDVNPAQLALTRLKLAMVSDLETEYRLRLLGHEDMPADARHVGLAQICERLGMAPDVLGDLRTIAEAGPDHAGRYEMLFARLRHVLADDATTGALLDLHDPVSQTAFLDAHPAYAKRLEEAFAEVMALPNLMRLFGTQATQNAERPFAEHLFHQTRQTITTLPARSNPYLSQLLSGRFGHAAYPWLTLPRQAIGTQVDAHQMTMPDALTRETERFDFIHLSNILDWLSEAEAVAVLKLAVDRLKPGGWLVIRQLNSSLRIAELADGIAWHPATPDLLARDRSFFYRRLHIGVKS